MINTYLTSPRYHLHVSAALDSRFKLRCDATARRAKPGQIQGGGVAESQPRSTKGGCNIYFYFLLVKNITC